MIVIADTSPINYLALIGEIDLLEKLSAQIVIPEGVLTELQNEKAPQPWFDASAVLLLALSSAKACLLNSLRSTCKATGVHLAAQ